MTARLVGVATLVLTACAGPTAAPSDMSATVQSLLEASAAAWNAGDLDGFLADYHETTRTSFVSGERVRYGSAWIREHYAPHFAPGAARDSLRFERVRAQALGTDHLLATARYVLHAGETVTSSGPFTLVLMRVDDGWKIIHDHTSRDPE